MAQLGDRADNQRPLAVIHAATETAWQEAAEAMKRAVTLSENAPAQTPVIYRRISG